MNEDVLKLSTFGAGLLGAVVADNGDGCGLAMLEEARLQMIERRILRIEMALRRTGVEVEQLDLPR